MSVTTFPTTRGGIKSIQRGVTTSATTVTITSVNLGKAFVTSYSDACTGDVTLTNSAGPETTSWTSSLQFGTQWASRNFGAYLASSTELVTSGAVRWEVVEFE